MNKYLIEIDYSYEGIEYQSFESELSEEEVKHLFNESWNKAERYSSFTFMGKSIYRGRSQDKRILTLEEFWQNHV